MPHMAASSQLGTQPAHQASRRSGFIGVREGGIERRLSSYSPIGDGIGQYRSHHPQVRSPPYLSPGDDSALCYSRLDGLDVRPALLDGGLQQSDELFRQE